MEFIGSLVYSILPASVTQNIWFVFAVVVVYAALSEAQSFVKDPKYGAFAKYDGIIQTILGVLGVWKKKSYSIMVQEQNTIKPNRTTTDDDPMKGIGDR